MVKVAPMLTTLVDEGGGVGDDYACLILQDADGCCPGVLVQLASGVLWEPEKAVRTDQEHGHEDVGLHCNPNAIPIAGWAGHVGYRGAGHRDRAAKDGAQSLQLLGIQGGTSADKVHCICSSKAGEQGGAQLLHRCHVIRCKLTDGLQVTLALARVLGKGHWDWAARLLPRW